MNYLAEKERKKRIRKLRLERNARNHCGVGYGGNPDPYILSSRYSKGYMRNGG